ncbi:MAG: glycosyltransferase family 2 protein [Anaerolineae bacterium]|nr:glycosyltransferase family 2 protein [Anaerolineae bacterium]
MKQPVKLVVVIPIGPLGSSYTFDDMVDTVESVRHYATPDRRIIIVDSSAPLHLGQKLAAIYPELFILRPPQNYGLFGGLYKALSLAFLYAHSMFDFRVLVRMDIDALMIGSGLADDALQVFEANPKVGMLGTYLNSGEGVAWPQQQLKRQTHPIMLARDLERTALLRRLMATAQANGYQPGEHVLGGVVVYNPALIDKLMNHNLLLREELRRSKLQEDHIFALLCKAAGMELGQFGDAAHPMGIAWRGLPQSPQQLIRQNKKIIHSTRFWRDQDEQQIRAFFRARRVNTELPVRADRVPSM